MKAYLSLGSNMDDREYYLKEAVRRLNLVTGITVISQSKVYETEPWGLKEQPQFWNMAVKIETQLQPLELLKECQSIENELGRKRIIKWGPRTIDIDILLYENLKLNLPELIVPHPHMEEREFVLTPLREIEPELRLPTGRLIKNISGEGIVHSL